MGFVRRAWWLSTCLLCACTFSLRGVDLGAGGGDGGGGVPDLAGDDLAMADLAGADLTATGGDGSGDPCALCPGRCGGTPAHCLTLVPSGQVTAADTADPGLVAVVITGDTNF